MKTTKKSKSTLRKCFRRRKKDNTIFETIIRGLLRLIEVVVEKFVGFVLEKTLREVRDSYTQRSLSKVTAS